MKKILSVLIAGALAAAVCVSMASCGGNSSSSSKAATTAPTKSTTAPVTTKAADQQNSASGTGTQTGETTGNDAFQSSLAQQGSEYFQPATNYQGNEIPDDKIYGGVWEQVAILNAVDATGDSGAVAVGDYKGTTPDGIDCWVVTVKRSDGSTTTYYSGYQFCYPDSSSTNSGESSDNGADNNGNDANSYDNGNAGNDSGNNGYDNGNNGYDNGGSQDDGEDNTVRVYPEN